jgi:hypothetical protein
LVRTRTFSSGIAGELGYQFVAPGVSDFSAQATASPWALIGEMLLEHPRSNFWIRGFDFACRKHIFQIEFPPASNTETRMILQ